MKVTRKFIGRLIVGFVLAYCSALNIWAQPVPPGIINTNTSGTNTYTDPFAGFNPTPVITYPTNTMLKWALTMPSYSLNGQLSLSPDGTLYVPIAGAPWNLNQSLWAINPCLVNTNDPNYPAPDSFTNWVFGFGNGQMQSTPTIDKNGTIYTYIWTLNGQWTCTLNALSPSKTNATVLWTFATGGGDAPGATAVGNDGTIYSVNMNYICALTNAPGQTNSLSIPLVCPGDYAVFYFTNVGLKWINYDTNETRPFGGGQSELCLPIIGFDDVIYCLPVSGKLYAISSTNGAILWSIDNLTGLQTSFSPLSPAIGSDGTIYYGQGTNFYAIDPKAALETNGIMPIKWVYHSPATNSDGRIAEVFGYSPVIGGDGTVYVETSGLFSETNRLFAFNPTNGIIKWSVPAGSGLEYYGNQWKSGSLAVAADGEIYVANSDGSLWSFDPKGNVNWLYQTDNYNALGSPLIGPDGTIYVCGQNGGEENTIVYAMAGVSPIACSAWPEEGRNARRTAAVATASVSSPLMTTNGFKFMVLPGCSGSFSLGGIKV
jgi:outer membrane protein assembly factor BamB